MAQTNAIVWRHYTVYGNANGVAWMEDGASNGKHVVAMGGWAEPIGTSEANASSTSTNPDLAVGGVPIIGTMVQYDGGSDTTHMQVGFSVPEGAKVRAHVWCLLAPGETN
jgi:hypothetical protein